MTTINAIRLIIFLFFVSISVCAQQVREAPCNLFTIKVNGKFGYINEKGEIVVKPIYNFTFDFSDGAGMVEKQQQRGYLNCKGDLMFPLRANVHLGGFAEGLATVEIGGKFGYIDKTGQIAIKPRFDLASDFHEGLAYVRIGEKYGYIDKTGKMLIEPIFDDAYDFSEGLAKIVIQNKVYFIDQTGKTVISFPASVETTQDRFSEGLLSAQVGNLWGFVDKSGRFVIVPKFNESFAFSEGLSATKLPEDKYGYINTKGEVMIKPQFNGAHYFSEGLALVNLNEKYGYIDKSGKLVIPAKFDLAWEFSNGLAEVVINQNKGYINQKGEYIWLAPL